MKASATRARLIALAALLLIAASPFSAAQELNDAGRVFYGLLRARDLTYFSLLHLDMRPAHAIASAPGGWGVETSLAYQNTWALSPGVEQYLKALPGRRSLGAVEVAQIRALPDENYLIDSEIGLADITLHYRISRHWGAYATLSAIRYAGGFGDGTIESFHDAAGFSSFGRPALARNQVNVILDLRDATRVYLGAPTSGGVLDPTFGLRFSGVALPRKWNLVIEVAGKLALSGQREFLSTGDNEFGLQATTQRLAEHGAFYLSGAVVRYGRDNLLPGTTGRIVPTVVLGYEHRASPRTHFILQGYASRATRDAGATDLSDLTRDKFQLSLGVYHQFAGSVVSFAITENLQNINNTPDIGLQLGWVYSSALRSRAPRR